MQEYLHTKLIRVILKHPRMGSGGVILVHDYFSAGGYRGISQAIKQFEEEKRFKLKKIPIGDSLSIAIVGGG